MIFDWLAERRRKQILQTPFPKEWESYLQRNMAHWSYLGVQERQQLRDLTQVFVAEKEWEGCGGLEMTDEIKVTIAGQACLLLLGLPHVLYKNVFSVIVYPTTVVPVGPRGSWDMEGVVSENAMPILGEAHERGPVILVWDAVKRGGVHPERGHNVVYHEFAHKLDMMDGSVNGTPPLESAEQYREWAAVCTREFEKLRAQDARGYRALLDGYGATNTGEFFAVATEVFFDRPIEMRRVYPELYGVLKGFYNQDTAARKQRFLDGQSG
ncbi:zinc-dependent peptidase [Poriferisphaera sp. WC338]|uniref:M90 family metallopeptidase n=1 Tax=Poriferisphaera sp. WC338 TaxID=3425129 RepID=UPI003D81BDBA